MKTRNSKSFVLRYGAAIGFGWCVAAATAVMAQQPAQKADAAEQKPDATMQAATLSLQKQAELIPVTGSHIRRVRTTDPSLPLLELDRAYIERSGATNPRELIRQLPQANSR